jgi:hypothetical protein
MDERHTAQQAADALAEIDSRRRQAVQLVDPLPLWVVLAAAVLIFAINVQQDLPDWAGKTPIGYLLAFLPLGIVFVRMLRRRATMHPSIRRIGVWILVVGAAPFVALVIWLPGRLERQDIARPHMLAGVILGVVGGLTVLVTDRVRRRYLLNRLAAR